MYSDGDYAGFLKKGVSGNVTRGVVVDVSDPLQSGRVRVWIPLFHGGVPQKSANDPSFDASVANVAVSRLGDLSNADSISCLPWAPVLGHNWAPTYDVISGTQVGFFGVFNVPKPGTEVFVIFEDDDPNFPIVIGSAFHQREFTPTAATTPLLEITPGTTVSVAPNLDYNGTVTQNYSIISQSGASLLLSDIPGQESVNLGGSINFFATAEVGDYSTAYTTFTTNYPNFPTTQSAPFAIRNPISNPNIPAINVSLVQPIKSIPQTVTNTVQNYDTTTVSVNQTPAPNTTVSSGTLEKAYPFGKNVPVHFPGPAKSSYGSFLAPRYLKGTTTLTETHIGVDIQFLVPGGNTALLAPINGRVISKTPSSTAGNYLSYLGADGYCHTFCHLSDMSQAVVGQTYTVGQQLGTTGNTGHSSGPHLHWEVWNPIGTTWNSPDTTIAAVRELARKNPSVIDPGHYPTSTSPIIFQDAINTWHGAAVDGISVVSTIGAGQLEALIQNFAATTNYQYNKPIGIQTSLTPGAESIFMRHPSGAYLGFDPDGNFKLFTPGSAEFRINRNLVFDVLGGIFNSCMALYNRVRTTIKSFAGVRSNSYQINAFTDFPTDKNSANIASKYHLPKIFTRIDQTRKIDVLDALKQSTSNIYYTLAAGALGQPAAQIVKNGYGATPDQGIISQIIWNFTAYDGFINKSWSTYINKNNNPIASHITPRILKAIMLYASLGIQNPQSSNGRVGPFQISSIMASTIKGTTDLTPYLDAANNIDLAVQFINSRADAMYIFLGSIASYSDNSVVGNDINTGSSVSTLGSKEYAMRAVLMDYIYCIYTNQASTDIEQLYKVQVDGGIYSYPALEQSFLNSSLLSSNSTYKAAVEDYGATIISITNSSQFSMTNISTSGSTPGN